MTICRVGGPWNETGTASKIMEFSTPRDPNGRPCLPEQPIFYPVLNEDYAIRIARDWVVPASGVGYVTRFEVDAAFAARYPVQQAGGRTILELWVPAAELVEFNRHIVGRSEVVHEFRPQPDVETNS